MIALVLIVSIAGAELLRQWWTGALDDREVRR